MTFKASLIFFSIILILGSINFNKKFFSKDLNLYNYSIFF